MGSSSSPVDSLYDLIANEEDARTCRDIPDSACRVVPKNFFLILFSLVMTKLGDLLINPKTVLAWLMSAVGAPPAMIAWLVPIRESGSLIPQLAIGAWVRARRRRKGFWVAGSLLQGACVLAMAACVIWLRGWVAGLTLLGLLVLFSLGRGFCSVAAKDVQGKCIPKQRRGRLSGLATSLSGIGAVVLTLALFVGHKHPSIRYEALLLVIAGGLWWTATLLFSRVDEYAGETGGGDNALSSAWQSLSLLKDDGHFRHFVITRALLLCSALASPFFVALAHRQSDSAWLLGAFLLASALASAASASFWGWMADRSSRNVMVRGAALASLTCLSVVALYALWPGLTHLAGFYPLAFFVLAVAHAGVRVGRKTYLVDMAGGTKRTDYVSVSNSVIGVLLLVTGGISALAALISPLAVILLLGLMGLLGVISALRLPDVE